MALATLLALAVVPASRRAILQAAGRILVAEDAIGPADVIVLASDGGAGMLEVADLVQDGVAPRVAVFAHLADEVVDREFRRRGIVYEDAAARSVRQLKALGMEAIDIIPTRVGGTEDQGRVLPPWCDQQRFRSVLVVADRDHSRRLRRVLRRSMRGHTARVAVRASRYSEFDPDRWWETRGGLRTGILEFAKLFLDGVRHPFS